MVEVVFVVSDASYSPHVTLQGQGFWEQGPAFKGKSINLKQNRHPVKDLLRLFTLSQIKAQIAARLEVYLTGSGAGPAPLTRSSCLEGKARDKERRIV